MIKLDLQKKMGKLKVIVLMGGKTPEHEISLITGREVVRNLNKSKYEALPVVISRSGTKWQLVSPDKLLTFPDPLSLKGTGKELVTSFEKELEGIKSINRTHADVCFIAMHGPFGEDGTVQGMLELAGMPYTGPGVLASALGMDKILFRKVMTAENLPIPTYSVVRDGESLEKIKKELGDPPYFVKPHNQGSSVGASIVKNKKSLKKALNLAFKYSNLALVDEYIMGRELTCGVLGNSKPHALPVVEIIPRKGEFFDYQSKYSESGAEEIVPAKISKSLTEKIQDLGIKVYKALGCKGFSRVDFILKNKSPIVLEINTIPGLTPMSLLPKAAKAKGISYSKLLDKIINYAIG
jgi:D-alanine-D-alanine ligase